MKRWQKHSPNFQALKVLGLQEKARGIKAASLRIVFALL